MSALRPKSLDEYLPIRFGTLKLLGYLFLVGVAIYSGGFLVQAALSEFGLELPLGLVMVLFLTVLCLSCWFVQNGRPFYWFKGYLNRNIIGYSVCFYRDKQSIDQFVVSNRQPGYWKLKQDRNPTFLLVPLSGKKCSFGGWQSSFAGLEWKGEVKVRLTYNSGWLNDNLLYGFNDSITVSPEEAFQLYDDLSSISTRVANLLAKERQSETWRRIRKSRNLEPV